MQLLHVCFFATLSGRNAKKLRYSYLPELRILSVSCRTLHDAQCGADGAIGGAEPLLSQRDPAGSEGGGETASPQSDLWGGINTCSHIGFCSYLKRFTGKRRPPSLLLNFWGLKKVDLSSAHTLSTRLQQASHMCADGRVFTSCNVDC